MKLCAGMGLLPFHAGGKPEIWIRSEGNSGSLHMFWKTRPSPTSLKAR